MSNLKHRYNLSVNEFNDMLLEQKQCCAICKIHISKSVRNKLVVDHNHKNGKVRKLLCYNCNNMIGFCEEKIDIIKNAIKYLEKYAN